MTCSDAIELLAAQIGMGTEYLPRDELARALVRLLVTTITAYPPKQRPLIRNRCIAQLHAGLHRLKDVPARNTPRNSIT